MESKWKKRKVLVEFLCFFLCHCFHAQILCIQNWTKIQIWEQIFYSHVWMGIRSQHINSIFSSSSVWYNISMVGACWNYQFFFFWISSETISFNRNKKELPCTDSRHVPTISTQSLQIGYNQHGIHSTCFDIQLLVLV